MVLANLFFGVSSNWITSESALLLWISHGLLLIHPQLCTKGFNP